jgi:hypothetical protein
LEKAPDGFEKKTWGIPFNKMEKVVKIHPFTILI